MLADSEFNGLTFQCTKSTPSSSTAEHKPSTRKPTTTRKPNMHKPTSKPVL